MKYANKRTILASAAVSIFAVAGLAYLPSATAETPIAPANPTLAEMLTSAGLTVNGYIAASYYHSSGYNTFHQFDVEHDTFQLDQAGLQVGYQPKEGFGAFADVLVGEDARILNAAENQTNSTFNARQ